MSSIFDHIDMEKIKGMPSDAQDALKDILMAMTKAAIAHVDVPEEAEIEVKLIEAYDSCQHDLHAAFREYALPIDPSLEGGIELQKELLPVRKEFLEYMQLMQVGLRSFLTAHPMPEIPQKFKDSVARNRM